MSLDETLKQIRPLDRAGEGAAQRRLDSLTKPQGSLGRLEELARRIAVIQGKVPPQLGRKLLFVFAADHGISAEGVSAYPKEVTAQMTHNFLSGGAAINVLARHHGVIDVGVDFEFAAPRGLRDCKIRRGTANFARGPAMTRDEAVRSVELGIELVREAAVENIFLLGAGDMGIGNTSSATAILCALTGAAPADVVGRGTGIDDATLARKVAAIEKGLDINQPDPKDCLDVLTKVGGLEIGAMTGVILAAAALRVPIVLDGFIAGAAASLGGTARVINCACTTGTIPAASSQRTRRVISRKLYTGERYNIFAACGGNDATYLRHGCFRRGRAPGCGPGDL